MPEFAVLSLLTPTSTSSVGYCDTLDNGPILHFHGFLCSQLPCVGLTTNAYVYGGADCRSTDKPADNYTSSPPVFHTCCPYTAFADSLAYILFHPAHPKVNVHIFKYITCSRSYSYFHSFPYIDMP